MPIRSFFILISFPPRSAAQTVLRQRLRVLWLTLMLRICLQLSRHASPISSVEELLLPSQLVLSDEKSGGIAAQQSLRGIALNFFLFFDLAVQ